MTTTDPAATSAQAPIDTGATHRTRADRSPTANGDPDGIPVVAALEPTVGGDGSRVLVVGQNRCWADENAVVQRGGLVDQRIVLQLAVVTHHDADSDVGAPADRAVAAEHGALAHLGEVPDDGAIAKRGICGDIGLPQRASYVPPAR